MPSVLRSDPFSPTLLSSESLKVSLEQKSLIMDVLNVACSDSAFAKKAYAAVEYILVAGSVKPVKVTSLSPNNALLGDPSFTLRVIGSNFDRFTKIVFAGHDEPTTFVSPTEVTTGVNMDVWKGPDVVQVLVESPVVASDPMPFTFVDPAAPGVLSAKHPSKPGVHIEPPVHIEPHTTEVK